MSGDGNLEPGDGSLGMTPGEQGGDTGGQRRTAPPGPEPLLAVNLPVPPGDPEAFPNSS